MSRLFSPKERDNLEKYDKFINKVSVRIEGGWFPAGTLPYDEDLLRYTLGLSPDSDQVLKRNRLALQLDSDKKTEFDKGSTSTATKKWNCSPQRSSNSQKTKNYRSSRAFRSKKTSSIQKFTATIAKFSWPFFRMLQTEKLILQAGRPGL